MASRRLVRLIAIGGTVALLGAACVSQAATAREGQGPGGFLVFRLPTLPALTVQPAAAPPVAPERTTEPAAPVQEPATTAPAQTQTQTQTQATDQEMVGAYCHPDH